MTEEAKTKEKEKGAKQQKGAEEKPRVFAVQRDLNGWRFSRRDFLAAASAAAAAVVAGKTAGCTPATRAVATLVPTRPRDTLTPMPTDTPTPAPMHTPTRTPTPTPTYTPTPTRTPTPTKTPKPTKTPTPTKTHTPTPTDTPVFPVAGFIADVTIPDGTVMEPGQAFTKTWRLKNVGAVEWGEGSNLSFHDGEQIGGTSPVAAPNQRAAWRDGGHQRGSGGPG